MAGITTGYTRTSGLDHDLCHAFFKLETLLTIGTAQHQSFGLLKVAPWVLRAVEWVLNGVNDFAKGSRPKHQKLFKRLAENIMDTLFREVKVSARHNPESRTHYALPERT